MQAAIDSFLKALAGQEISGQQAMQLATALHAATVDTREFNWVATTFEDVSDSFCNALEAMPDEVSA